MIAVRTGSVTPASYVLLKTMPLPATDTVSLLSGILGPPARSHRGQSTRSCQRNGQACSGRAAAKPEGHGPGTRDEVRRQPLRRRGQLEASHPGQDLAQHGVDLDAGDVLAEAPVRARAEGDMRVLRPRKVQDLGPLEGGRV